MLGECVLGSEPLNNQKAVELWNVQYSKWHKIGHEFSITVIRANMLILFRGKKGLKMSPVSFQEQPFADGFRGGEKEEEGTVGIMIGFAS